MKTSLFSRICSKSMPWYLYLVSFIVFCGAEVLIENSFSVSLGAGLVIILFLICLFSIKALYYAITAPVPPPISLSDISNGEPEEPNVPASTSPKHKPTAMIIILLCLCVLSSGICYYIGSTASANKFYSLGYEEGQSAGYEDGVAAGYQTGYDLGSAEGSQSGYDSGYSDGYTSGKLDAIAASNAAAEASRQAAAEAAAQEKADAEAKRQAALEAARNSPAIQKFFERGGYGDTDAIQNYLDKYGN